MTSSSRRPFIASYLEIFQDAPPPQWCAGRDADDRSPLSRRHDLVARLSHGLGLPASTILTACFTLLIKRGQGVKLCAAVGDLRVPADAIAHLVVDLLCPAHRALDAALGDPRLGCRISPAKETDDKLSLVLPRPGAPRSDTGRASNPSQ